MTHLGGGRNGDCKETNEEKGREEEAACKEAHDQEAHNQEAPPSEEAPYDEETGNQEALNAQEEIARFVGWTFGSIKGSPQGGPWPEAPFFGAFAQSVVAIPLAFWGVFVC